MSYPTTVIAVNSQGKRVKAEITCGGKYRGFTDENTGSLTFDMNTNERYSVSAKRYGEYAGGEVKGGQEIVLRLK
ncbi:MAG: hypothetical protein LBT40_17480 [Deltaproteobacteria bacterium]|jgi:hypothetical protein|nr:hypothetical protein [Deltaproteobacteria bacterium]